MSSFKPKFSILVLSTLLLSSCIEHQPTELEKAANELQEEIDNLGLEIKRLRCSIELNGMPMPELEKRICNYLGRPEGCSRPSREEIRRAIDWIVEECARRKQP